MNKETNNQDSSTASRPLMGCAVRSPLITPFYQDDFVTIYNADCRDVLPHLDPIDLVVTSPPYDNLRNYQQYSFDFETTAENLFRVTKEGGIVVWVVGDATINGTETGTSFRQALFFKEIGFNLHDTMICAKKSTAAYDSRNKRYKSAFEYMFVFSKGVPNNFNPIKDKPCVKQGQMATGTRRNANGELRKLKPHITADFQARYNIWEYATGFGSTTLDKIAYEHPAIFPEKLAADHIISWSNEGDTILDPFAGSGTTLKMAKQSGRKAIGIEISKDYCQIAIERLKQDPLPF